MTTRHVCVDSDGLTRRPCQACADERTAGVTVLVPVKELRELQEFRDRVIDACVCAHIYVKEHDTDPKRALNDLMLWHQMVALDPAVCKDMADLRDKVLCEVESYGAKSRVRNLFASVNVKSS